MWTGVQSRHHEGGEEVAGGNHHLKKQIKTQKSQKFSICDNTMSKDLVYQGNRNWGHIPICKDGDGIVGHCVASAQCLRVGWSVIQIQIQDTNTNCKYKEVPEW